jgi:hypothetical protein
MDGALSALSMQQVDPIAVCVAVIVVVVSVLLALQLCRGSSKAWLDAQQFKPLPLARIDQLTHNTKRFVFSLPDPKLRLGLPTGQHITFLAKDADGKDVYRCVRVRRLISSGRGGCVCAAGCGAGGASRLVLDRDIRHVLPTPARIKHTRLQRARPPTTNQPTRAGRTRP